uniref:RNA-binding region-containing protein 3-like n=1 Tax=Diabrotica virgifera virgifera TaxID=50390 RepID=A0A6P7G6Q9_DIAVI
MVCKDTLKIKNLPKELSDAHKEDFARHFGASKVKVVTSRVKEKSVVYAKFDSEEYAKSVMFRLHQINVLNCRLCVEYAENDIVQGKPKQKRMEEPDITSKKAFKTFVNKITSFNDSVNFHQPPPSHLKYLYPKANRATINNIVHVLTTIPRFYTQVDIQVHKKIEMKVSSEALLHTPQKEEKPRSIGTIPPKKPEPEKPPSPEKTLVEEKPEEQEDKTAITAEELAANRINHKDLGVLPVFKNYHPGVPTCRLYIKNCAKTVTTKDLEYIYNR